MRFWSAEFFAEAQRVLAGDSELVSALGATKTSFLLECTDKPNAFLISVEGGRVETREADPAAQAEFRLAAPYEEWVKVVSGKAKLQGEVLRGNVRFRGSMPRMLLYLNKVLKMEGRILAAIKDLNPEF